MSRGRRFPKCPPAALAAGVLVLLAARAAAEVETPTSSGPVSQRSISVLRIPMAEEPPKIDGVMAKGEWEDSAALSAFWYAIHGQYFFMAPFQTQLQVYFCYDRENLYLAYTSPVHPRGSWLRALGRYPDVIEHPLYGIYRDDYYGWGLQPYHDPVKCSRMGGFYCWTNPISVMGDVGPGVGRKWQAKATTRSEVTDERWVQEVAIPLASVRFGPYDANDAEGSPVVPLPLPAGRQWLFSLRRCTGEWGVRYGVKNEFSDTTSKLIFDPKAVSVQVNELGPIMEDVIDVHVTLKNHADRSETVRLGFFVESAEGLVYSSYNDAQIKDGLVELVPGQRVKLRLRKPLPGITVHGNLLWFDVRSAGRPAKPLFLTKLVHFHSQDKPNYRQTYIASIAKNRPPRRDFDYRLDYCYHTNRVSAVVDTGIYGASDEARTAVEAQLVVTDTHDETQIATASAEFIGPFACIAKDLPTLEEGHTYRATVLLFDHNKRIVGEDRTTFQKKTREWMLTEVGLDDVVWEPFTPMVPRGADGAEGFETLNHRFALAPSGLPSQVTIRPDPRELPLEWRGRMKSVTDEQLIRHGRGPQLRKPYRLVATVAGKPTPVEVVQPARLVRRWRSELEYASRLRAGPLRIDLTTQYDCDGAMHVRMTYGSQDPVEVANLALVVDFAGPMDMTPGQGRTGVVYDSADTDPELYYSHFVPWLRFGSNERGFSWICRSEAGWRLDRDGAAMTLERDRRGEVTWRVRFVNHPCRVSGRRKVAFTILTHPAKPRPKDWRRIGWFYRGDTWAHLYMMTVPLPPERIKKLNEVKRRHEPGFKSYKDWRDLLQRSAWFAAKCPRNMPYEQVAEQRLEEPPWRRFGICRNVSTHHMIDRYFEERAAFWLARHVRVGRKCGFWWDETWPMFSEANWSDKLATGDAYLRDRQAVEPNELPWHRGFLDTYMRRMQKRLARVMTAAHLPVRNFFWANDAASAFESFAWDIQLVEMAGSHHPSIDIDSVVAYPKDRFRFFCQKWTGTIARLVPGYGGKHTYPRPGDNPKFDRQYLGRALAHDITVCFNGPHGTMHQPEHCVRFLNALIDFGLFDEDAVEFVPYWHTAEAVRYGPDYGDKTYTVFTRPPEKGVYVSAHRRRYRRDGRTGYQVLFTVMSEADEPVEANLHLLKPGRFFGAGGRNQLTLREVLAGLDPPGEEERRMLERRVAEADDAIVLRDLETGRFVHRIRADAGGEHYGPLYIPPHDYRILWGFCLTENER
jgi:hypothetical protein